MILACVCGGWLEVALTAGGITFFVAIWDFISNICKRLGCLCQCHTKKIINKGKKDDKKTK